MIASTALKISDADAAIAAFDMYNDCKKRLSDTTLVLQNTRAGIPKKVRTAKWQGVGMGGLGAMMAVVLIKLF